MHIRIQVKAIALFGAEWFYFGFFSLGKPFPRSQHWAWQVCVVCVVSVVRVCACMCVCMSMRMCVCCNCGVHLLYIFL